VGLGLTQDFHLAKHAPYFLSHSPAAFHGAGGLEGPGVGISFHELRLWEIIFPEDKPQWGEQSTLDDFKWLFSPWFQKQRGFFSGLPCEKLLSSWRWKSKTCVGNSWTAALMFCSQGASAIHLHFRSSWPLQRSLPRGSALPNHDGLSLQLRGPYLWPFFVDRCKKSCEFLFFFSFFLVRESNTSKPLMYRRKSYFSFSRPSVTAANPCVKSGNRCRWPGCRHICLQLFLSLLQDIWIVFSFSGAIKNSTIVNNIWLSWGKHVFTSVGYASWVPLICKSKTWNTMPQVENATSWNFLFLE
jgi:hypothetical protein